MNENDRKFFLKRFFSFNASSFNSGGGASSNGSFNEASETDELANNHQTQHVLEPTATATANLDADEPVRLRETIINDESTHLIDEKTTPPPAIFVNSFDESAAGSHGADHHQDTKTRHNNENKLKLRIDVNASTKSINDSMVSTPSSIAPLIPPPAPVPKPVLKKQLTDEHHVRSAKTQLQQQNSIELKPFRKKEVQINESNLQQFSTLNSAPAGAACYESSNLVFDFNASLDNSLCKSNSTCMTSFSSNAYQDTKSSANRTNNNNDSSSPDTFYINVNNNSNHHSTNSPQLYRSTNGKSTPLASPISMNGHLLQTRLDSINSQIFTFQLPVNAKCQPLRYRNLGKSGLRVSQLGLGTWVTFGSQISDDVADEILSVAYQNGINLFDTAEVYAGGKAELALGRILKKKNWRRSSYIVCTKIYFGGKAETEKGLSRKHIIEGVKASLERLQLDYVDIVFANKPDAHTPMEEIVRAFTHLINTDKTFYWGTSRWNTMEIMEAYSVARQFNLIPPICEQAEYHLFQREEVELNLPDVYARIGIGTMTWSPLACGLLTGKYDDGIPVNSRANLKGYQWLREKILNEEGKRKQNKIRELQLIAEKLNCTMAQLSIAWCLRNESVHCVLLGASSVEQLLENIQSLQVVPKLSYTVLSEIDRILGNKPISRHPSKSENLQKT